MVSHQRSVGARVVEDGVAIVGGQSGAERGTEVPEHIATHTCGGERGLLPFRLDTHFVAGRHAVLFQQAGFVGCSACGGVVGDPAVTEGFVRNAPWVCVSVYLLRIMKGMYSLQLDGYRWKVPKSRVLICKFLTKSTPSVPWYG